MKSNHLFLKGLQENRLVGESIITYLQELVPACEEIVPFKIILFLLFLMISIVVFKHLRYSEIYELDFLIIFSKLCDVTNFLSHQDVVGFQVTMNDSYLMQSFYLFKLLRIELNRNIYYFQTH